MGGRASSQLVAALLEPVEPQEQHHFPGHEQRGEPDAEVESEHAGEAAELEGLDDLVSGLHEDEATAQQTERGHELGERPRRVEVFVGHEHEQHKRDETEKRPVRQQVPPLHVDRGGRGGRLRVLRHEDPGPENRECGERVGRVAGGPGVDHLGRNVRVREHVVEPPVAELVLCDQPTQPAPDVHERDRHVLQVLGGPLAVLVGQMLQKNVGGPVQEDKRGLDALHGDRAVRHDAPDPRPGLDLVLEHDALVPSPAARDAEPAVARERHHPENHKNASFDPVRQQIEHAEALPEQVTDSEAGDAVGG